MRGTPTVFEAADHIESAAAVGVHAEGLVSIERFESAFAGISLVVGRHIFFEVADILAGPLTLLGIPPHVPLLFAPWRAVGSGGGTVVNDAGVLGPGESSAVAERESYFFFSSSQPEKGPPPSSAST
jgi:hypothetical protein